MNATDLARGKRLLSAERTEPFSRSTTYALSEWLDHHAAELIVLAEWALLHRPVTEKIDVAQTH